MGTTTHPRAVTRTPEERAEHRRNYLRQYMREYRAANADKTRAWRVKAAMNLLQREGYRVTVEAGDDA